MRCARRRSPRPPRNTCRRSALELRRRLRRRPGPGDRPRRPPGGRLRPLRDPTGASRAQRAFARRDVIARARAPHLRPRRGGGSRETGSKPASRAPSSSSRPSTATPVASSSRPSGRARWRRPRRSRRVGSGQPLAIAARRAARPPFPGHDRAARQARALHRRPHLRRRPSSARPGSPAFGPLDRRRARPRRTRAGSSGCRSASRTGSASSPRPPT